MKHLRRSSSVAHDTFNALVLRSRVSPGKPGPLKNTTFIAKANISVPQRPTTCALGLLQNYQSPIVATSVLQLIEAGLTLVGNSNMDEFGMGSLTTLSIHGPTRNPLYEEDRIAGGSSGGSAAAVAGGLADFALGTDTGGSVRQPASYCGIVGFKPSYGRFSRYGVVPYAQGYDCVGVLARLVSTTRSVYDVLNHPDPRDITMMPKPTRDHIFEKKKRLRVAIPQEFILGELQGLSIEALEKAAVKLMDLGHEVCSVSMPILSRLLAAYYTLAVAEAALNLSRYDGISFGQDHEGRFEKTDASSISGKDAQARIVANRSQGFGPEVKRRIILGNYVLSSESGDNFTRATEIRSQLVRDFNNLFASPNLLTNTASRGTFDLVLGPTAFGPAPTFAEHSHESKNILNEYLNDVFTVPASMAGLPAISVPFGGVGLQIIGQYAHDALVLDTAEMIESL